MNAVGDFEVLAEAILQKARTEAQEIVERARRVAEREVEHAREEAEASWKEGIEQAQRRVEQERRRMYAQIELDVQRRRMAKQEELIQVTFRSAMEALRSMPRDEVYERILVRLIEEGMGVIGEDAATVFLNGVDREAFGEERIHRLEKQVSEHLGRSIRLVLSDQLVETSGGVFLRSEDGRVSFDNTFEARLERVRDDLRGEIAEALFGKTQ